LLLEQLLGNAFAQDSQGSFSDDFSNRTSDCFGDRVVGCARLGSGALQQAGEQFSLRHTENTFIGQQSAGETIDHLSCCHRIPPGKETQVQDPGSPVSEGE
jgi:hypothetical protein